MLMQYDGMSTELRFRQWWKAASPIQIRLSPCGGCGRLTYLMVESWKQDPPMFVIPMSSGIIAETLDFRLAPTSEPSRFTKYSFPSSPSPSHRIVQPPDYVKPHG
jgi:hypothetical protein